MRSHAKRTASCWARRRGRPSSPVTRVGKWGKVRHPTCWRMRSICSVSCGTFEQTMKTLEMSASAVAKNPAAGLSAPRVCLSSEGVWLGGLGGYLVQMSAG